MNAKKLMLLNCDAREDSWESLGLQGDQVNPEGNQPWIFIDRTDAKVPIFWPPDEKSQLTGKDPDAGKDWRQKEKWAADDETVRKHHWLNGLEQTLGYSGGQRSLACFSLWGLKESDMAERLENNKYK